MSDRLGSPTDGSDGNDESVDLIAETDPNDPADLTGEAASRTADKGDVEVDEIAAAVEPNSPGHGMATGANDPR